MADASKTDLRIVDEFDFELFWQTHGKKIIAAGVAAALVLLGVFWWQRQAAQQAEEASARLAAATTVESLQAVANDFAGKEVGAQALIRLGDALFRQGKLTQAAAAYQRFLDAYPRHMLAESALLGLAAAKEAQGDFGAAKAEYERLLTQHPNGYAALTAKLGLARCLENLGQTKEARQMYEELAAASQGSPLQMDAYLRWVVLSRDQSAEQTNQVSGGQTASTEPPMQLPVPTRGSQEP